MKCPLTFPASLFLTFSALESITYTSTLLRLFLDQSGLLLVVFGTSDRLFVAKSCKMEQICIGNMAMWFALVRMSSLTRMSVLGRISTATANRSKCVSYRMKKLLLTEY